MKVNTVTSIGAKGNGLKEYNEFDARYRFFSGSFYETESVQGCLYRKPTVNRSQFGRRL